MQPRAGLKETVVWSAGLRAALRRPGCCWQGLVLKPGWDVVAHSSTPAQGPHCPLQLPSLGVGTLQEGAYGSLLCPSQMGAFWARQGWHWS